MGSCGRHKHYHEVLPCPWPKCPNGHWDSYFYAAEYAPPPFSITEPPLESLANSYVTKLTFRRKEFVHKLHGRYYERFFRWEQVG